MNVTSLKEKITLPQTTKNIRDIRFPGLPDNHLPQISTEDGIGYGEIRKIIIIEEEIVEKKKDILDFVRVIKETIKPSMVS